jgi:hypothetical protein
LVTPVYFPFTFIPPVLLEAMSLCFRHVFLYEPAHANRHAALQPWIDNGFLQICSPFETVIDEKPLKAALRDFTNWGLFQQYADIAYLKTVGTGIAPVNPEIPSIASEIKGKDIQRKASDEAEFSTQLFLHLAQEFDQHSWELKEELSRIDDQYLALQGDFRQDQELEEDHQTVTGQTLAGEDPGDLMMDRRMAAWNRLFQRDPFDPGLLITGSYAAYEYLLADVEKHYEVLNLDIRLTQGESEQKATTYPSLVEDLQGIFDMVLTAPWSQALQEKVVDVGRKIAARITDARDSRTRPSDKFVSLSWHVVPDYLVPVLLNRCCGVKKVQGEDVDTDIKNTLVGLIQTRRTAFP